MGLRRRATRPDPVPPSGPDRRGSDTDPLRQALSGLVAAFGLLSLAFLPGPVPAWLPGALAAVLASGSSGALADGRRYAGVAAGAPALYGYPTMQCFGLHPLFPMTVAVGAAVLGFGIGTALGAPVQALLADLLVALLLVILRVFDSVTGPPRILLPTSTTPNPVGDRTILFLPAWQADALLLAAGAAGVVVVQAVAGAAFTGAATALIVAVRCCSCSCVACGTRRRDGRESSPVVTR